MMSLDSFKTDSQNSTYSTKSSGKPVSDIETAVTLMEKMEYPDTMSGWNNQVQDYGYSTIAENLKQNVGKTFNNIKRDAGEEPNNIGNKEQTITVTDEMYQPSEPKAYVVGVLLGDGWFDTNGRNRRIGLECTDKDFAEQFGKQLSDYLNLAWSGFQDTNSLSCSIREYDEQHKQDIYAIRKGIKPIYNHLVEYYDKTYTEIVDEFQQHQIALVRGLWDSEGAINSRKIKFTNGDVETVKTYVKVVLNNLDIDKDDISIHAKHVNTEYDDVIDVILPAYSSDDFFNTFGTSLSRKFQMYQDQSDVTWKSTYKQSHPEIDEPIDAQSDKKAKVVQFIKDQ